MMAWEYDRPFQERVMDEVGKEGICLWEVRTKAEKVG